MSNEEYIEFSQNDLDAMRAGIAEELFEIKQFAVQRTPVLKLYQRKMERLEVLIEIQNDLFPEDVVLPLTEEITLLPYNQATVLELFTAYFSNKNKVKQRMFGSQSVVEVLKLLHQMCVVEKEFGRIFDFLEVDETVLVSKEPDAMLVFDLLKETTEKGIKTLEDYKINVNNLPNALLNEMKRLSLLAKKF